MNKKILIAGYHGFGNCGDEAILLAMKNNIITLYPNVSLTVLSFKPKETEELYGIKSVDRFKPFKVLSAIKNTDILISGGGSLLQDETSIRSLMYYLTIIFTAKLFNKKVMLYSNGIGPVRKKISRLLIRLVVDKVDVITLREESSFKELKSMGVKKPDIHVTADPAFTLKGSRGAELLAKENIPMTKPFVGVSVRPWKDMGNFVSAMGEICDYICERHGVNILFIPMQRSVDLKISEAVKKSMRNEAYILRGKYSSDEILGIIGELSIILSMRLHTLVFAGVQNVPMLGFVYDPKVKSFIDSLSMPDAGDIHNLDMEGIKAKADKLFENLEEHRAALKLITDELKERAKLNDEYLKRLF